MALVTEDGTGRADAESLATVDAFKARCTALGVVHDLSDLQIERNLRKATEYMARYRDRWSGDRKTATQATDFPRYNMPIRDTAITQHYANDTVPLPVRNACIDLAWKASSTDLDADQTRAVKRSKVGPIETEYEAGSPQSRRFPAIETMLSPYFKRGALSTFSVPLVRG